MQPDSPLFSVIYPLTPVLVTAGVSTCSASERILLLLYYLNSSAYLAMTLAVYNFFRAISGRLEPGVGRHRADHRCP